MADNQKQLKELYKEIEQHYAPERGWCDDAYCTACERAEAQVEAAKDAARKGFYLNKKKAGGANEAQERRIYESGYDKGRNVALQEAHQWAAQSAQRAEMAAKNKWYQKGLREGHEMAKRAISAPAAVDPKQAKKQLMDQVLQECRVIGESNPQMNPAMNALRHRLKKIN